MLLWRRLTFCAVVGRLRPSMNQCTMITPKHVVVRELSRYLLHQTTVSMVALIPVLSVESQLSVKFCSIRRHQSPVRPSMVVYFRTITALEKLMDDDVGWRCSNFQGAVLRSRHGMIDKETTNSIRQVVIQVRACPVSRSWSKRPHEEVHVADFASRHPPPYPTSQPIHSNPNSNTTITPDDRPSERERQTRR